jgi:hypothetical protein
MSRDINYIGMDVHKGSGGDRCPEQRMAVAGILGWYLACFPDSIVPLPQGLSGFWLAVLHFNLPIRRMGSLYWRTSCNDCGPRLRKRTEATLEIREKRLIPACRHLKSSFHHPDSTWFNC